MRKENGTPRAPRSERPRDGAAPPRGRFLLVAALALGIVGGLFTSEPALASSCETCSVMPCRFPDDFLWEVYCTPSGGQDLTCQISMHGPCPDNCDFVPANCGGGPPRPQQRAQILEDENGTDVRLASLNLHKGTFPQEKAPSCALQASQLRTLRVIKEQRH